MNMDAHQALIPIMNRQYQAIYDIESQWGIRLHEGDQRPRIEYFHDAVRALTSGEGDRYAKHSRLSIEHLAYDLSQLRQAQANPVSHLNRNTQATPATDIVKTGELQARRANPDRETRQNLIQLYKDYSVLYAALFAEAADLNFKSRQDEIDATVQDIALVEKILNQLANGAIGKDQAMRMLEGVEQDTLRERIQQAVQAHAIRHREAEQLVGQLKQAESRLETERRAINSAHMHFATSRLAVYEESKETIKRLAAQGMNLAGKFVESALQAGAGRGAGRGV